MRASGRRSHWKTTGRDSIRWRDGAAVTASARANGHVDWAVRAGRSAPAEVGMSNDKRATRPPASHALHVRYLDRGEDATRRG